MPYSYVRDCKSCEQKIYLSKLNGKIYPFEDRYCTQFHNCTKCESNSDLVGRIQKLERQFTSHEVRIRDFERRLNHE